MNKTTIKRGIGAVVLALIAATLLAFLLKDKAAQRQEVVEIALPGTDGSVETTSQSTRLPTLTTDNSGNVIANAGTGTGVDASVNDNANSTGSSISSAGTVIASAGAAAASGAVKPETTQQAMDFSVKPKAAKASEEFLNLDLVNNGQSSSNSSSKAKTTAAAAPAKQNTTSKTNTDQGVVIASSAPKSSAKAKVVQPRLIGEKRSAPPKSASTARVITKKVPAKKTPQAAATAAPAQAGNGFAIQLLATSSLSRANSLKNVMAGEGYPAYVTKTQQNGKTLYRVRIGQYAAKAQAVSAQAAMKRRYKKNTNVNRSAIVAR